MTPEELQEMAQQEHEKRGGFRSRINVCTAAGCLSCRSGEVLAALRAVVKERGLQQQCDVRGVGCLGPCAGGPVLHVEPADVYYCGATPEDAAEIVDSLEGEPVARLADERGAAFYGRQAKIALENSGRIDPERIEGYVGAGGYQALQKALTEMEPGRSDRGDRRQRPARARRRRLPHRAEVGHRRQGPQRRQVRRLQRRRGRPRRLHGPQHPGERPAPRPGGHGHGGLRRRRAARLHLRARRVPAGHRAPDQGHPRGQASWACWAAT